MTRKLLLLTDDEALIELFQSLDGFDVHVSRENWYVETPNPMFDVAIADLDWVRWNSQIRSALKRASTAFGVVSHEQLPLSKPEMESFHDIWVRPLHPELLPHRIEKGIEYRILSSSKHEFSKYVPHQISINAATIAGYSEVLLLEWEGKLTEEQSALASAIANNAKNIQRLITMFRDVAVITTQTLFEPRRVAVSEVISALQNHHIIEHYRQNGQDLLLDIADDLPHIFTDLTSIVNALHLLFTYAVAVNVQNDTVALSVAYDQTQGVKFAIKGIQLNPHESSLEEYLEQLYLEEKYEESDRQSLASARACVYQIGSWLRMTKEVDNSLTFYFTLPIAKDTDT